MFNRKIPIVFNRAHHIALRSIFGSDSKRRRKCEVARRRKWRGEWVGDSQIGVAERPLRIGNRDAGIIGRGGPPCPTIQLVAAEPCIVEEPASATNRGPAVAGHVPCKPKAWHDASPVICQTPGRSRRETLVSFEQEAAWGIGEQLRSDVGVVVGWGEVIRPPPDNCPRNTRFVSNAVIDRQPFRNAV